ncbi:NAD(P)/FAD-dependent oxidoreductase [Ilumatobacter sp.]|uniref:NAD(P)/FAD-dependent oxidoreductase n=1 Tax=Ilumatobacter sp. TaxID=1967498 RepID=UPI00345DDF8F
MASVPQPRRSRRHRVVIVGGGFGGLAAAKALRDDPVDVTLIDRRNHHLFQPLLYQVATAGLNPADIATPIRSSLRKCANVSVRLGEVVRIDDRAVVLADGTQIEFDHLVVATGVRHSYFGHDDWEQLAPGLKSIEDALEIRRRVLLAFEIAERTDDPTERDEHLNFVVVGGGPTGVELAGAIAEIATRAMSRDFRSIDPSSARVILVEGADRVLGAYTPDLAESARRQLERLGVEVRLDTLVDGIDERGVDTNNGRIDARTVLWSAGVQASPLGAATGAELDRAGRVVVDEALAVPGRPNVFVIGDLAHARWGGEQVPGVAQGAIQGGTHAAACIRADLAGRARPVFRYTNKGELATIGRSSAVGVIGKVKLRGWLAWMAWWMIHILFLINFRSRLVVLFSWAWSYVTFQRGSRLITSAWRPGTDRASGTSEPSR